MRKARQANPAPADPATYGALYACSTACGCVPEDHLGSPMLIEHFREAGQPRGHLIGVERAPQAGCFS